MIQIFIYTIFIYFFNMYRLNFLIRFSKLIAQIEALTYDIHFLRTTKLNYNIYNLFLLSAFIRDQFFLKLYIQYLLYIVYIHINNNLNIIVVKHIFIKYTDKPIVSNVMVQFINLKKQINKIINILYILFVLQLFDITDIIINLAIFYNTFYILAYIEKIYKIIE